MEAIVLAGGFGTRLREVVSDIPKPMAEVNGKPFLSFVLDYLVHNGIHSIILAVGYKHEVVRSAFGNEYRGMELRYSVEDEPLGTGGAIKRALSHSQDDNVFIANGDTFFNVNLQMLYRMAEEKNAELMLSLKHMECFDRYGCVKTDRMDRIIQFTEKAYKPSGSINGGIYFIKRTIFDRYSLPSTFSFEKFIQKNIESINMYGFNSAGYFIDIGIPEDFSRAQTELELQL